MHPGSFGTPQPPPEFVCAAGGTSAPPPGVSVQEELSCLSKVEAFDLASTVSRRNAIPAQLHADVLDLSPRGRDYGAQPKRKVNQLPQAAAPAQAEATVTEAEYLELEKRFKQLHSLYEHTKKQKTCLAARVDELAAALAKSEGEVATLRREALTMHAAPGRASVGHTATSGGRRASLSSMPPSRANVAAGRTASVSAKPPSRGSSAQRQQQPAAETTADGAGTKDQATKEALQLENQGLRRQLSQLQTWARNVQKAFTPPPPAAMQ